MNRGRLVALTLFLPLALFSEGALCLADTDSVTMAPAEFATLRVYPNPWRKDRHASLPITFDQLTTSTTIKIFTVAGHWVRTLPVSSSLVTWDLKTDSGDSVASGIYVYLLTSDTGATKTGQVVVIR